MQYKIALIGEAWGEAEERARLPFLGPAGHELNSQLEDAGIARHECFLTNVFNLRPAPSNDIKNLCGSKRDDTLGYPPLSTGQYLLAEYRFEIERLYRELEEIKPNIAVALGGTALWALTGVSGISRSRGTLTLGTGIPRAGALHPVKVLPTYHPAAVLRQYELRAACVMDLMKAKRNADFPEIRRPVRYIHMEPSLDDIRAYIRRELEQAPAIAVDIETARGQITCIGFAPRTDSALVIPFWDARRGGSYWPTDRDELEAWALTRSILELPIPKIFQNGLYDLHWLWRRYGLKVNGAGEDTMLLHHALQPESPKALGYLGSLYTDEVAWKHMRKSTDTSKKEDT